MTTKYELIVAEQRRCYDALENSYDKIDTKLIAILSSCGLFVALAGLLFSLAPRSRPAPAWLVILPAALLVGILACVLWGLWPRTTHYVVPNKADILQAYFLSKDHDEAFLQMMRQYIIGMDELRRVNSGKATALQAATCLFALNILSVAGLFLYIAA